MNIQKFLLLSLLTSNVFATETQSVKVFVYQFTSSFSNLTLLLEKQAVAKAKEICPDSRMVLLENSKISVKRGPLASGSLASTINLDDKNPTINFPSHPYAELEADFTCD